jgi:hypothetical protein
LRVAFDGALEEGIFKAPEGFGKVRNTELPEFLYAHFARIFSKDGLLLDVVDIPSLRHIRQVCSAFYKLEFPISKPQEKEAIARYMENEAWVCRFLTNEKLWSSPEDKSLVSGAALLVKYVFDHPSGRDELGFNPKDILPRHGPGKVSTGELGLDKWHLPRYIYSRLHQKFPYYRYFYHNTSLLGDLVSDYRLMVRTSAEDSSLVEPVSKIALVPKDSRGPRIIAEEPLEVQYIQQGMRVAITTWLHNHPLTSGFVNFDDQTVNQELALKSSNSKVWATLDMKDASDLVSVDLVEQIFRLKPGLLECLLACRTQYTRLPNGEVVHIRKFAGMGAATCFPVEALVFWSICVAAIARVMGSDLKACTRLVYVYGDDLIVPWYVFDEVCEALESCGLKVNRLKSFVNGNFRESCGVDAFRGENVTPVRFSKLPPATSRDGVAYVAWVAYANALEAKGYPEAASTIWAMVEGIFGPTPYGTERSPFPCRIVADPSRAEELNSQFLKRRERKRYQRIEFYVYYVMSPKHEAQEFDSWSRLNRNLISGAGDDPSSFTLPREARVFRGWMAV